MAGHRWAVTVDDHLIGYVWAPDEGLALQRAQALVGSWTGLKVAMVTWEEDDNA